MLLAVFPALAAEHGGTGEADADAEAPQPAEFGGEVARGDTVVHRFKHGGSSFEFRLVPFSGGWTIRIGDPSRPERNFVAVATAPFRGVNAAVIEGWHFRNSDNTGPNAPGEKNVNAPGMEREFAFVLDGAGYAAAFAARETLMRGASDEIAAADDARRNLEEIPTGRGRLVIHALELGNLVPNQRAVIDRMAFTVHLAFPG